MSKSTSGRAATSQTALFVAEQHQGDAQRTQARAEAAAALGVVIQELPVEAIEPDPGQPRRVFDDAKLRALAESIKRYGLLQEPGVVALEGGAVGGPARFRLIWGERRWRACGLAGLTTVRCKVLPRPDDTAVEQLRTREKQWTENAEREDLSAMEEAIAIEDAVDLERKLDGDAHLGDLIDRVATKRGINGMVARNLVAFLKTPRSLQTAMLGRKIGREVGFELTRYWNRMAAQDERKRALKREIQFRELVASWAAARGLELDSEAMNKYALETFQDPKIVKATCRKVEEADRALVDRFDAVVERAQRESWTVARARAALGGRQAKPEPGVAEPLPPLYHQVGKGGSRLIIYLDRLRDPDRPAAPERAELLALLRSLVGELGGVLKSQIGGPCSWAGSGLDSANPDRVCGKALDVIHTVRAPTRAQ